MLNEIVITNGIYEYVISVNDSVVQALSEFHDLNPVDEVIDLYLQNTDWLDLDNLNYDDIYIISSDIDEIYIEKSKYYKGKIL